MPKILFQVVTTEWNPIDMAIRARCGGWASHAEFVLEDGTTFGAHMDGVKHRPPSSTKNYTRIIRFDAPYMEQAYAAALTQDGKPYDFTAIAGIALDRDWREDDSWFCSEMGLWTFEQTPAPWLSTAHGLGLNMISPRDLLLSPVPTAVWSFP
jgi:uncharacterized protein YycO